MTDPRGYYGPITGTYYESELARDYYEREAAQRLTADSVDDGFGPTIGVTADQIKAAHNFAARSQQDQAKQMQDQRAAEIFVELHPEYIKNQRNANALQTILELEGKTDSSVSVEDIEAAYEILVQRGLLDIDAKAAAEQKKTEIRGQAEEVRKARGNRTSSGISAKTVSRSVRPTYSENDLESMPLDQLRELAMKEAWE